MRVIAVAVLLLGALLLCACPARPATPALLFGRVPADKLANTQDIQIDAAAFESDRFQLGLGDKTMAPQELARTQLPNGALVTAKFAGGGSLVLARVGTAVTGLIRLGGVGFEIQPYPGGHRLVPHSWKDARPLHEKYDEVMKLAGKAPAKPGTNEPVTITVQFAYTKAVLDQRTLDGIKGLIATAIKQLNIA